MIIWYLQLVNTFFICVVNFPIAINMPIEVDFCHHHQHYHHQLQQQQQQFDFITNNFPIR